MRALLFCALSVLLLACAPRPLQAADPTPAPAVDERLSAVGQWAFSLENPGGGAPLAGTMTISPDGSGRIAVPSQGVDAAVERGRLEHNGAAFSWSGRFSSPMGPLSFTMRGEVDGDRLTARNELAGLGSFRMTGERQRQG